jgi:hypothetical protein
MVIRNRECPQNNMSENENENENEQKQMGKCGQ